MNNSSLHLPTIEISVSPTIFVGMAFHWMWVYVLMFVSAQAYFAGSAPLGGTEHRIVTVAIFLGMLIVSIAFASRRSRHLWPPSTLQLGVVSIVGGVSAALCLAFGILPWWLTLVTGVLAGIASSYLFLCWFPALGAIKWHVVAPNISLSFITSLLLCLFVSIVKSTVLVYACGFVALFVEAVLLRQALAHHGIAKGKGASPDSPKDVSSGVRASAQRPIKLLKSAVVLVCFGYADSVMRELALKSMVSFGDGQSTLVAVLIACVCSFALVCFAFIALPKQSEERSSTIFSHSGNILLFVGIVVVLLALVPTADRGLYIVVCCSVYVVYETYLWSLVAQLTERAPLSRLRALGLVVLLLFIGQFITPLANEFIAIDFADGIMPIHVVADPTVVLLSLLVAIVLMMTGSSIGDALAPAPPVLGTENARTQQVQAICKRYLLTETESSVLEMLVQGRSVGKIAETFHVSENTTKTHVKNIYRKTGVHSKQQLLDLVEGEHV